jgi:2-polyprenyl-3-methyl-5-hydroxy-6-metoxy-1,4-benzoquinol methylase
MATVFMKWLETNPKEYDRGIQWLTLGKLRSLKEKIAYEYVRTGTRVLEIGCGTGTLTMLMAGQGAIVTGIDASTVMLGEAQKKIAASDFRERITLHYMDASMIGERFSSASFDMIVSTLVFSELPPDEQRYVLEACASLLAPGGRLLIADEVLPKDLLSRLAYYLIHLPLALLTWLITRTSTKALREFETLLAKTGFRPNIGAAYLGNSLLLYVASLSSETPPATALPPTVIGRLRDRVTMRTLLIDLWTLFFRILPPYPKVRAGLYTLGHPTPDSPVLVTGNFDLTVRRLVQAIDGRVDVWVLVADSAGINVWCAAGGGYFTAEKVIAMIKSSHLDEVVNHHALILPQLCANGVDGWRIRRETGWGVHWGPVRAADIPAYLAGKRKKTDDMRWVRFPLMDRLEMVTVTLGFYALLILLPVVIFWRNLFWPIALSMLGLSYFYAVVHPWLPGRDGLFKSIPLTLITLIGLSVYSAIWDPMPAQQFFHWMVGLTGLSVFTAAELQGMSPLMRGEQANWTREALIALVLGALYWLVPLAGWWR